MLCLRLDSQSIFKLKVPYSYYVIQKCFSQCFVTVEVRSFQKVCAATFGSGNQPNKRALAPFTSSLRTVPARGWFCTKATLWPHLFVSFGRKSQLDVGFSRKPCVPCVPCVFLFGGNSEQKGNAVRCYLYAKCAMEFLNN